MVLEEEQSSILLACSMLQEEAHKARALLSSIHQKRLNTTVEKTSGSNTPHLPADKVVTSGKQVCFYDLMDGIKIAMIMVRGGVGVIGGSVKVGDMVFVPKLGKEVKVIQVSTGKRTLIVQSGSLQLRLSFSDISKNECL